MCKKVTDLTETVYFCSTDQMPRQVAHRRYCGTMYFPSPEKRELWSEYMKDLKSRQVNDSTMKFFGVVKFFKCQPEVCILTLHVSTFSGMPSLRKQLV